MRFVNVFFLDTEAGGGCGFFFNGPLRIVAGTGGYLLFGNHMLGIDEEVGPGQEQQASDHDQCRNQHPGLTPY